MAEPTVGSPAADARTQTFIDSVPNLVAGSSEADDALKAIVTPLIGAADPAPMTLAQLNTKWSGIDPNHVDSAFPTVQRQD